MFVTTMSRLQRVRNTMAVSAKRSCVTSNLMLTLDRLGTQARMPPLLSFSRTSRTNWSSLLDQIYRTLPGIFSSFLLSSSTETTIHILKPYF